jgi:hypothetical protein
MKLCVLLACVLVACSPAATQTPDAGPVVVEAAASWHTASESPPQDGIAIASTVDHTPANGDTMDIDGLRRGETAWKIQGLPMGCTLKQDGSLYELRCPRVK